MADIVGSKGIFLWLSELYDEGRAARTASSCSVNIKKLVPNALKLSRLTCNLEVFHTLAYTLTTCYSGILVVTFFSLKLVNSKHAKVILVTVAR
jgi:hypothetical protein